MAATSARRRRIRRACGRSALDRGSAAILNPGFHVPGPTGGVRAAVARGQARARVHMAGSRAAGAPTRDLPHARPPSREFARPLAAPSGLLRGGRAHARSGRRTGAQVKAAARRRDQDPAATHPRRSSPLPRTSCTLWPHVEALWRAPLIGCRRWQADQLDAGEWGRIGPGLSGVWEWVGGPCPVWRRVTGLDDERHRPGMGD
jgi:hypothetical protein